jgi:hypothetical protein
MIDIKDLKIGYTVLCIGGGFEIECEVIDISPTKIKITDNNVSLWVNPSDLEFDKRRYRDQILDIPIN